MSGILEKYAALQIQDDRERVNKLLESMQGMSEGEASLYYGGSAYAGNCFIKDSPGEVPCVIEMVISEDGTDCFATLFRGHPVFNSRDTYREARIELLECIHDIADADIRGLAILCPVRKRKVMVRDLGIKQLLDLIQSAVDTFTGEPSSTQH
jgi:hypothetical protein